MTAHSPKISIIIPVYNVANYLRQGLNSVMQQTFTDYEVILVNDGSTDDSLSICEEYAEIDSRFKLLNQENTGVSEARNRGISHSCGEYVTFMDSDDWVEEGWLEAYVHFINCHHPDFLVQGIIVDFITSTRKECIEEAFYKREEVFSGFRCLEKRGLAGFSPNKMYKRTLIKQNDLRFCFLLQEDILFNIKYLCHVQSLAILPSAYYHYMQRGNGSLVTRRYPFLYMMQLNIELRDARLHVADVFDKQEYRTKAFADYLGVYTVLLLSLYDRHRGISDRKERLSILHEYQHERKHYKQIPLSLHGFAKKSFAYLVKLPPPILNWVLEIMFTIKKRIRL